MALSAVLQSISDRRLPYVIEDVHHRHVCELESCYGDRMRSAGSEVGKNLLGNVENKSDKIFTLYNYLGFVGNFPCRKLPAIRCLALFSTRFVVTLNGLEDKYQCLDSAENPSEEQPQLCATEEEEEEEEGGEEIKLREQIYS